MIEIPAYKYKLKSGQVKWYANFYCEDWTGVRKHICKRGFSTKREAVEYERAYIEHENNTADITFGALVEVYLEDQEHRLKPTTMENKRYLIESKLLPYFEKQKINDITTIKIRKWQNMMLSYKDDKGMGYSQTYLKTVNNQLSAILNYAVSHYGLRQNPCRLTGSIGKSRADSMNIWTKEQFDVFIESVTNTGMKLAFNILFYTGMRLGEVLALTPADILPDKRIDINKNFVRVNGQDLFMDPKTEKSKRCIAIPNFLYEDIQSYIKKLYGIQESERIFCFTKSGIEKEIVRKAEKCGLPRIRVHDLRHSHASMLIDMGFDILEISERLGHESAKTTLDTYAHLYPEKDKKLASALDDLNTD